MGKYFGTDGVRGRANEGLTFGLDNTLDGITQRINMRVS